jgi:putative membrane protein
MDRGTGGALKIVYRILINATALYATQYVPGIEWHGDLVQLLIAGALLGLFNVIVRPVAMLLSVPFLILSLGLFYFVLNGILLYVASFFLPGYAVAGIIPGMLGSLVMALVNWVLGALVSDDKKD